MTKTFSFELYYWNNDYKKAKKYAVEVINGQRVTNTKKYNYEEVKNLRKIEKIDVKPNNEIIIKCANEKPFIFKTGQIIAGSYVIDPLQSAFCNKWRYDLPLLKYKDNLPNK